jgi:hypothetical protein
LRDDSSMIRQSIREEHGMMTSKHISDRMGFLTRARRLIMKRSIFKLLAVVGQVPENHEKSLLRREAPVVKHRLAGLCGLAMTTFFLVNQPGVTWGQSECTIAGVTGPCQKFPQPLFDPVTGTPKVTGDPSCSSAPPDLVTCGVKTEDRHLLGISFNPSDVAGSQRHADVGGPPGEGVIVGDPSCAAAATSLLNANGDPEMICAVIGADHHLWGIRFSSSGATTFFRNLSGSTAPQLVSGQIPSCDRVMENLVCGVRGTDNTLWVIRFNPVANTSSGLRSLGGPGGGIIAGDPSCAGNVTTEVTCAVKGTNGHLWGIRFASSDPTVTSGFKDLDDPAGPRGTLVGQVINTWDCASSKASSTQEVTCAVTTLSNALFGIRFAAPRAGSLGFNSGFQDLGVPPNLSPLVGKPSCTTTAPMQLMNCIVKGENNRVFGVIFDPIRPTLKPQLTDILGPSLGVIVSDPSCATTPSSTGMFGICAVIDGNDHLWAILGAE